MHDRHTSRRLKQTSPPPTCLSMNVDRAWSNKSRVFAIHLSASDEASGSSLNVVANESSVANVVGVARFSEPVGFLPSVLTASRASAASIAAK